MCSYLWTDADDEDNAVQELSSLCWLIIISDAIADNDYTIKDSQLTINEKTAVDEFPVSNDQETVVDFVFYLLVPTSFHIK